MVDKKLSTIRNGKWDLTNAKSPKKIERRKIKKEHGKDILIMLALGMGFVALFLMFSLSQSCPCNRIKLVIIDICLLSASLVISFLYANTKILVKKEIIRKNKDTVLYLIAFLFLNINFFFTLIKTIMGTPIDDIDVDLLVKGRYLLNPCQVI